jgi:hypothetical protein
VNYRPGRFIYRIDLHPYEIERDRDGPEQRRVAFVKQLWAAVGIVPIGTLGNWFFGSALERAFLAMEAHFAVELRSHLQWEAWVDPVKVSGSVTIQAASNIAQLVERGRPELRHVEQFNKTDVEQNEQGSAK